MIDPYKAIGQAIEKPMKPGFMGFFFDFPHCFIALKKVTYYPPQPINHFQQPDHN